jgi:hypothetical protein
VITVPPVIVGYTKSVSNITKVLLIATGEPNEVSEITNRKSNDALGDNKFVVNKIFALPDVPAPIEVTEKDPVLPCTKCELFTLPIV